MVNLKIANCDITRLGVDVIVNAANPTLRGGGGVDGAIHLAAGPRLKDACLESLAAAGKSRLAPGEAMITPGFNLEADYIIHTVGPVYDRVEDPHSILANCYKNSLDLAKKNSLKSIAFPGISTGVYGFPKDEALEVIEEIFSDYDFGSIDRVVLAYFSDKDVDLALDYLDGLF